MIRREDILSLEYLKKTDYTGSHMGMRYRLECVKGKEGSTLRVFVWPEPFNFARTPQEQKQSKDFSFDEDGILDAVSWMNDRLYQDKELWEQPPGKWKQYSELK